LTTAPSGYRLLRTSRQSGFAAGLELSGQLRASIAANAAVLSAPARGGCAPLSSAGVVNADTAARNSKVKLTLTNIRPCVSGLDNHLLAGNGGGSESKPVILSA
jgi:hypothetical protein